MKKLLAILLVCALAATMCFVLAGCGDDKKSDDKDTKNATQAATTTAPTAPAATKAAGGTQSGGTTQQATPGTYSQASGYTANDVWYAGISENDALSKALDSIPEGGALTAIYPGYYNDGTPCWVIEFKGESGTSYVCYATNLYCTYIEFDEYNDDYAGITAGAASDEAAAAIGNGAVAYEASCGYYYDGTPCWMVSVIDSYGNYYLVYVSSDYCYTVAFGDYGYDDGDDGQDDGGDYVDGEEVYGGLTREAAMANAAAAAGEGANCYGAYETVLNDGTPAWSATVETADGSWITVILDGNGVIAMG